jgi:hypothetical protein
MMVLPHWSACPLGRFARWSVRYPQLHQSGRNVLRLTLECFDFCWLYHCRT